MTSLRFPALVGFLFASFLLLTASRVRAEEPESFMIKITHAYDAAWDRGDVAAMTEMLDPECVFRSPFQTRLGRAAIQENVFRNVKRFRDTYSKETQSKIEDNVAYSFQESTFNDYGRGGGNVVTARRVVKHLFIFTRRPGQDWKIRSMFTFEEKEIPLEPPAAK
jgi:ketosteroid isomerase-like protein